MILVVPRAMEKVLSDLWSHSEGGKGRITWACHSHPFWPALLPPPEAGIPGYHCQWGSEATGGGVGLGSGKSMHPAQVLGSLYSAP